MRLFLTGGTGFIGSHVLLAALSAGHEVLALRRSPLSAPKLSLPCQPNWLDGELHTVRKAWLEGVDVLIHLASAGVSPRKATWSQLIQVNVVDTCQLFELASEAGVRRFVVAGTIHEYGNSALRYDSIPPSAPLEPLNAYGASKAAAYQLISTIAIESSLELFYGRISSAYGEGQFAGNFWPSLRRAALSGENFAMTSGRQICDFITATAVAEYLLEGCVRTDISPGFPLVVNIGSGVASSLLAFAEEQWLRLAARGRLLPGSIPERPDQIKRYVPDLQGLKTPVTSIH